MDVVGEDCGASVCLEMSSLNVSVEIASYGLTRLMRDREILPRLHLQLKSVVDEGCFPM